MKKLLEGVRVIDFGMAAAGPSGSKLLAEFGAEVIVAEPIQGTSTRWMTMYYDFWSDGKKSVPIDVKNPEGKEVLLKLVASADVFMSNFRAKALRSLGLTYEDLKKVNPGIIYAVLYGWGKEGPLKDSPAYDITAFWARGGYMRDMAEKGSILVAPQGVADCSMGEILAAGISAALYHKEKTGEGTELHTSIFNQAIYLNNFQSIGVQFGEKFQKTRFAPTEALVNTYRCKDGEYVLMFDNQFDRHFFKILKALGRGDLAGDPRWTKIEDTKWDKAPELVAILDEAFAKLTSDEAVEALSAIDVSIEKCCSFEDTLSDPQVLENKYLFDWELSSGPHKGEMIKMPSSPIFVDGENNSVDFKRAPRLGEHTMELLTSVGYTEEQVRDLAERKIVTLETE